MISIARQPYELCFTTNPMVFEVSSDQYFLHDAVKPFIEITVVAKPTAGNSFYFTFINPITLEQEQVYVVAVGSVVASGQMPDNTFPGTITNFATSLLQVFQNIPVLNANYSIEQDNNKVILTALVADENLIIKNWTTSNGTTSFTASIGEVAEPAVPRFGYEMKAVVMFESDLNSGQFEQVATLDVVLSPEATGMIDIQTVIADEVRNSALFEMPFPNLEVSHFQQKLLKRYYVKFLEYWNDSIESFTKVSSVLFAHHGGINALEETNSDAQAQLAGSKKFLTWWPSGKLLATDQTDWLSWMNPFQTIEMAVILRVYTNAGVETFTYITSSMQQFRTLTFQVGHDFLDLPGIISSGTNFNKWSFQIKNLVTNEFLSEEFFYYKSTIGCKARLIMYLNSFGVPETFLSYATWNETANVTRELAMRSKQFMINRGRAQKFTYNVVMDYAYQIETQVLRNIEAEILQEILISTEVFVWEDLAWNPLIIDSESITTIENQTSLRSVQFTAVQAFQNEKSSQFGTVPKLIHDGVAGGHFITLEANQRIITNYAQASIYNTANGSLIETVSYDSGNSRWYFTDGFEGNVEVRTSVTDQQGNVIQLRLRFVSELVSFSWEHEVVGLYKLTLGVNTIISPAFEIDWGVGTGFESTGFITSSTEISKTYAAAGKKKVTLKAQSFSTMKKFVADNFSAPSFYGVVKNIDFGFMPNLEILHLLECGISGTLLINKLSKLSELECTGNNISMVDFGYHPDIEIIDLNNCNLTPEAIEQILLNLWKFRKAYRFNPTLTLTDNPGAGSNATAVSLAIINGTGIYTGEGLESDYSWTINGI